MYYHNENSFVAILVIILQDESFVIVFMMVDLTLWLRTMKLRKATITWATRKDELEFNLIQVIHRVIERSHQYYTKLNPTILKRIVEFEEHCEEKFARTPITNVFSSNLVDPASSHTLVSKIKPCMCKYKQFSTVKLRTAHYISYSLFDNV